MAKKINLKNIPPEVYAIVLDEQNREKRAKGIGMFSLESTIYKIIKEYFKMKKELKCPE